jgi:Cytochrome C and Quinol oxidase polypeptide I/GIY-YIG catalytic domain/NUMOD1 domain
MWFERWFLSSNAKDIGVLYLIYALFAGLVGTAFSVLIRLELSGPGVQYIADNQLYNSIITAHAIIMIFFMVKKYFLLNSHFTFFSKVNNDNNDSPLNVSDNNKDDDKADSEDNNPYKHNNNNKKKYNYVKVLVDDPYNNRDIILKVTKKQKGVYIWETIDGGNLYVGHSINLYNRISSYFMPSILNSKARRVLRYLNKYGFANSKLTIYIMNENSSLEQVVELEQHFIDSVKPNLNVDLVANGSGYHGSMSQESREKLRKQRGTPVYIYNAKDFTLLYVFESKQQVYNLINIHHTTLSDCLDAGNIYLDTFFFSLDLIEESPETNILDLDKIQNLVSDKRKIYKVKHPAAKSILAEFKDDPKKNIEFDSLTSLAKHLKGDRQVIRAYLTGEKSSYYRGKWKFTYKI